MCHNDAPANPECAMNMCECRGKCRFPEHCDSHGHVTRRRDRTIEEQRSLDEKRFAELGLE